MTMSGRKPKPFYAGAMAMDDEYQDFVRNVPEPDPTRAGWLRQRAPGGGYIGWPESSRPCIQPNHVDGPYVIFRNGEIQWLTFWERFLLWRGRIDAEALEYKYRPELSAR